jgi:DNA-binding response OmpR family regulator
MPGALDGEQALRRWEAERPDIVLLDANLPKLGGFEVCRRIRQSSATSIIMLTARKEEVDVVRGLELEADDDVGKPFSVKLLVARMEAVLRRRTGPGISSRPARCGWATWSWTRHQTR